MKPVLPYRSGDSKDHNRLHTEYLNYLYDCVKFGYDDCIISTRECNLITRPDDTDYVKSMYCNGWVFKIMKHTNWSQPYDDSHDGFSWNVEAKKGTKILIKPNRTPFHELSQVILSVKPPLDTEYSISYTVFGNDYQPQFDEVEFPLTYGFIGQGDDLKMVITGFDKFNWVDDQGLHDKDFSNEFDKSNVSDGCDEENKVGNFKEVPVMSKFLYLNINGSIGFDEIKCKYVLANKEEVYHNPQVNGKVDIDNIVNIINSNPTLIKYVDTSLLGERIEWLEEGVKEYLNGHELKDKIYSRVYDDPPIYINEGIITAHGLDQGSDRTPPFYGYSINGNTFSAGLWRTRVTPNHDSPDKFVSEISMDIKLPNDYDPFKHNESHGPLDNGNGSWANNRRPYTLPLAVNRNSKINLMIEQNTDHVYHKYVSYLLSSSTGSTTEFDRLWVMMNHDSNDTTSKSFIRIHIII